METLVLRCPTEVTSSLGKIVATALEYIKYDPVCGRKSRFSLTGAEICAVELRRR
jgi:hypothetical protein